MSRAIGVSSERAAGVQSGHAEAGEPGPATPVLLTRCNRSKQRGVLAGKEAHRGSPVPSLCQGLAFPRSWLVSPHVPTWWVMSVPPILSVAFWLFCGPPVPPTLFPF